RATRHYVNQMYADDSRSAAEAARALAAIGTPTAVNALFQFAANPPPPPAYRNAPAALTALENLGESGIEILLPQLDSDEPTVRRMMVEVIQRSAHPDKLTLLGRLARDSDESIQRAALEAIGSNNEAEAAALLASLVEYAPVDWVKRSLTLITQPQALDHLREISRSVTTLRGFLQVKPGEPLIGAAIQVMIERKGPDASQIRWGANSPRTLTNDEGGFALALFKHDPSDSLALKVIISSGDDDPETFHDAIRLEPGQDHQLRVTADRFLRRLLITFT
ncbi:MAG: hypothetical protein GYB68_02920, partial [Chloroflexi bacterium]|nr:hypothetical protein [Chloroflexota bacterium]